MSEQISQDAPAAPTQPTRRSRGRLKRWLIVLGVLLVLGVIAGELVARLVLRLGDPPLYVADPQVEYLMAPSRTYHRFYAKSSYNRWSMRNTPEVEKTKTDPRELRIMIMGDSVVNGGPQTDDAALATARLVPRLARLTPRPVMVANVSAGSWVPGNLLGYSKKFGFLESDIVVIVLNHEDSTDVPTFNPLGAAQPTRTPVLALEEAVFRYVPSWLGTLGTKAEKPALSPERQLELEDQALGSLRELIAAARESGAKVIGVLHACRAEAESGQPLQGTRRIRQVFAELGVPVTDSLDAFRTATQRGFKVYRDDIHPLPDGQSVLADVIFDALQPAIPR